MGLTDRQTIVIAIISVVVIVAGYSYLTGNEIRHMTAPYFEISFDEEQSLPKESSSQESLSKESSSQESLSKESSSQESLPKESSSQESLPKESSSQESLSKESSSQELLVKIIKPHDGQTVPNDITVEGSINKELPANSHHWLLAGLQAANQWWPQGGGSIQPSNGAWSIKAIIGGGPDSDIGKEHQIAVMLADEEVDRELNDWVTTTNRIQDYPALDDFTLEDKKVFDMITVVKGKG